MIISMTGYGRGESKKNDNEIIVEVRSLNNRYLDITTRLPKSLFSYEDELKVMVRKHLSRGRVNIVISQKNGESQINAPELNVALANHYFGLLKQLTSELKLTDEPKLSHLIQFEDIFEAENDDALPEEMWECTKIALEEALKNLVKMRSDEGETLREDLELRIGILEQKIAEIETLADRRVDKEYERIQERIANINKIDNIDEGRLESEIAMLASRIDITEECIRFKSHNKLFLDAMHSEQAAGRKLNFLLQEMTREANTIGAKAYDADIAHLVVDIKEEVEKVREQVQNIE